MKRKLTYFLSWPNLDRLVVSTINDAMQCWHWSKNNWCYFSNGCLDEAVM